MFAHTTWFCGNTGTTYILIHIGLAFFRLLGSMKRNFHSIISFLFEILLFYSSNGNCARQRKINDQLPKAKMAFLQCLLRFLGAQFFFSFGKNSRQNRKKTMQDESKY